MQYLKLGRTGLAVSRLGLGMMSFGDPARQAWALTETDADPVVRLAVEAGITLFDTADMYSDGVSEQITGRLLRKYFSARDDYVLATKVYYPTGRGPNDRGLSRKHIAAALVASLRRLGSDFIDLYQVHRWDAATPIDETLAALDDAVRAGMIRYVGASAMNAWQLAKAHYCAQQLRVTRFASMQIRYNLVNREPEADVLPLCHDAGIGVLPYSPLARGLLAGTHRRTGPPETARAQDDTQSYRPADHDVAEATEEIARERGASSAQVALAWLLSKPAVTAPLIGATKVRHVQDATAALTLDLDGESIDRLEVRYRPHLPGEFT